MASLAGVQSVVAALPPPAASAIVLSVGAALTVLAGLIRCPRRFVRQLCGALFILLAAATFWPLSLPTLRLWSASATTAAGGALLIHLFVNFREPRESHEAGVVPARLGVTYLVAALLIAALLMFHGLGSFAGTLQVWEAPVVGGFPEVGGFARAFDTGQSVASYAAERFIWDDGLLSAGHTSLFYGAPTYALFHVLGFSAWTLRVSSVIALLLSIVVIYILARRFFGAVAGGAAALLLALNACALFYGRYGSSPAGTVLAVLLALLCTWLFLDEDRSAWWMGGVCAAALYVATLQYSPGRIVVLILLAFIPLVLVCQWRRLRWQRVLGFAVIIAAAVGIWRLESSVGAQRAFLYARGEQFFDLLKHPQYVSDLFGKDLLGRPLRPETMTVADEAELLYRVLQVTVPQYLDLIGPSVRSEPLGDWLGAALPHLCYGPLFPFIIWGFAQSLRRWRSWPQACLLLWLGAGTVPLLLTNRIDSHRIMLFVIPLSLWAALGVREAAYVMAQANVPRSVQHLLAAALSLTVVYNDVHLLWSPRLPPPVSGHVVAEEVEEIPGPVAIGALIDHEDLGFAQLAMLDRVRRDPARSGSLVPESLLTTARNPGTTPSRPEVAQLQRLIDKATLILAPAAEFRSVASVLQQRGARVAERGTPKFRLLRLDGGAAATGISDAALQALPTIVIPPTPTPIPLAGGPQVSLSTLTPFDVSFGFAPPKIDRSWSGDPIVMAGVRYDHGIGTHAWCRMTYPVPPNATAFQAIIGLSDDVRDCAAAAVTFEVHDDKDALLFDSSLVDATTPPRPIHVDLRGAKSITLVVTEGGNGRDCDHANWASPAFLLSSQ